VTFRQEQAIRRDKTDGHSRKDKPLFTIVLECELANKESERSRRPSHLDFLSRESFPWESFFANELRDQTMFSAVNTAIGIRRVRAWGLSPRPGIYKLQNH